MNEATHEDSIAANPALKPVLDAMAKAIYDSRVQAARRELAKLDLPTEKITGALKEVRTCGDDRSAVITLYALLDDLVIELLRMNLNPEVKGGLDRLFDGYGLLSTSSARLTMAAALYWVHRRTYVQIDLLRKLRNLFAHHVAVRSLSEEPAVGLFGSMHRSEVDYQTRMAGAVEGQGAEVKIRPLEEYTLRQKLVVRGASLIQNLCCEIPVYPVAKQNSIHPGDLLGGWDDLPESIRVLRHGIAVALWPVIFEEADG